MTLQPSSFDALMRRPKAELAEEVGMLRNAIESISDGFVVYDADDRLVIFNSSFRDMFPQKALEYLVPGIKYEMLMTHVISLY